MSGPLHGVRVIELAGIGPAPFATMLLADMGADVVRVDRPGPPSGDYVANPVLERGRRSIALDLKSADGKAILLRLVAGADVLLESYRPGVAERLGIGPAECLAVNPALVYGRMSGWGQTGPRSTEAGHDINYISLTGALHAIGRAGEAPVPPMNLVGDFGGGAMFLVFGMVCALLEARASGRGQVVDANVLDGTTLLMSLVHGLQAAGRWRDERGVNLLDTGCPYYDVYECADGGHVAVGTIEQKFFANLLAVLGLDTDEELARSHRDRALWPRLRTSLRERFLTETRDEWARRFDGAEACVTPVLDLAEAQQDKQAVARGIYSPLPVQPGIQAVPAPRFSVTGTELSRRAPRLGEHTREILAQLDLPADEIDTLLANGRAVQSAG